MTPKKGKLSHSKSCQSPSHKRRAENRKLKLRGDVCSYNLLHNGKEATDCQGSVTKHADSHLLLLKPEDNNTEDFLGFDDVNNDEDLARVSSWIASIENTLSSNIRTPYKLANRMRVLALFDGIGTGLATLEKLGIQVEAYLSCEIDENALAVQRFNFFGKVTELGSVTELTSQVLDSLGRIDVLLGGSPCNEISRVNWRRKGIHDKTSTGWLFFEYSRVLQYLLKKCKSEGTSLIWLLENTASMDEDVLNDMNCELRCKPLMRCASAYVPMKRRRFFWGNVPLLREKGDTCTATDLTLQDFLKPYRVANTEILNTLTSTPHSQRFGPSKNFPVMEAGKGVLLNISEMECLFGFPIHYTGGTNLSVSTRRKLLGRAWSVHVIEDILRPLCALYKSSYLESLVF